MNNRPINPIGPINPNFNMNDPSLKGGVPLQRVPVIPWEAFVACGLQVYKDGKVQLSLFDPKPMATADEVLQVMLLLISSQGKKPGPIAWDTVPEEVQRHFKFKDEPVDGVPRQDGMFG